MLQYFQNYAFIEHPQCSYSSILFVKFVKHTFFDKYSIHILKISKFYLQQNILLCIIKNIFERHYNG